MSNKTTANPVLNMLVVMVMLLGVLGFTANERLYAAPESQASGQAEVLVNVNQASLEELQIIRGIGPSLAQRILDYRQENGRFETPDDLGNVRGIGDAKLNKIKTQISL